MEHYVNALKRTPKLAAAAFFAAMLVSFSSALFTKFAGHGTAFDDAAGILFHYPESIRGIFAFFSVTFFFLSLTLIFEPSFIGDKLRDHVLIPSLHISEHMLSLSVGIFCALAIVESFKSGIPYSSVGKTVSVVLLLSIIVGGVSMLCAMTSEFLARDFRRLKEVLGRWSPILLILIGLFLFSSAFMDTIWNYKPEITQHK